MLVLYNIHQVATHTEMYIKERANTKFFCLKVDNHLNWKNHTCSIPKTSFARLQLGII